MANAGIADPDNHNFANGNFMDCTSGGARLSRDDIRDGASLTLLFSENVQATTWDTPGKEATVFLWHSTTQPLSRMRINGGSLSLPLTPFTARPSSRHRGGVYVAFADTHVQFLHEDIDYQVYAHLMTSHDQASDVPTASKGYVLNVEDFK